MATLTRRRGVRPDPDAMTLMEHLGELRRRLIVCICFFAVAVVVAYLLYGHVLQFLEHPYCELQPGRCSLVALSPLDGFGIRLDVAGYGGLVLSAPVLLYEIWSFVTPGLRAREKRYALPFVLASTGLFVLGAFIAWLTFPHALSFLVHVGGSGITPFYTAQRYLSLILLLMAVFGLTFEFPVVLVALELAGVVTTRQLKRFRRLAIVVITLVAAIVTPSSDPFSMLALAIPMLAFYELSIVIGRLANK